MKQSSAGFGLVGIIGLIAVLGVGALILTQNIGSTDVSRESNPTDIIADAQNTLDNALEASGGIEMKDSDMGADEMSDREMLETDSAIEAEISSQTAEITLENNTDVTPNAVSRGTFTEYSPEKLALAESGDVVLFFHASWCPSCRALETDIKASLSDIPANTHILKIDYDSATALRQQYGVVRQHTLVNVAADGTTIKTLTGLTNTLEQLVAQI